MKLKAYNWVLEGLAALVILVGVVTMLIVGQETMGLMVIRVVGLGVLFFTLMRVKPILASRDDKDYLIIMLLELLVTLVVGAVLLFMAEKIESNEKWLTFSQLTGIVFYIRGIIHFYTTSKRYELHDLVGFFVNVLLISFGFLFLFNTLEVNTIVWIIYGLSFVLTGYLAYRSWNGYGRFRLEKENKLKLQDFVEKDKKKEKVVEDPKSIDDEINPVIIDEPKDDRPHIDVQ